MNTQWTHNEHTMYAGIYQYLYFSAYTQFYIIKYSSKFFNQFLISQLLNYNTYYNCTKIIVSKKKKLDCIFLNLVYI